MNKTISIPYEINEKLKEEDNASALITKLLVSHYGDNRTDDEIIEDVKGKIKEKEKEKKINEMFAEARKKEIKDFPKGLKNALGKWIIMPPTGEEQDAT